MSVAEVPVGTSWRSRSRGCTRCAELGHYAKKCPYAANVAARKLRRNLALRASSRPQSRRSVNPELLARVVAVAQLSLTSRDQAAQLGISVCALHALRHQARRAGHHLPTPPRSEDAFAEAALARVTADMTEPCRCGLRGKHVCLGRADSFMYAGEPAYALPERSSVRRGAA